MKVTVLIDNLRENSTLKIEHGLSLYIEIEQYKCLVDVGLSDAFLSNANDLGIDISDVDYLFISHGHTDHLGGLLFFLEKNKKAQVIISSKALTQRYFSKRKGLKDISPNLNVLHYLHRFQLISEDIVINDDIQVISKIKQSYPLPKANEHLYKDTCYVGMEPDDFNHELVFCFGKEALLVCTGCAHQGILNILETVTEKTEKPIKWAIGGFHLLDADDMNQYEHPKDIGQIALQIDKLFPNTAFFTGHCTGDNAFKQLKEIMGMQLEPFFAGLSLELNN